MSKSAIIWLVVFISTAHVRGIRLRSHLGPHQRGSKHSDFGREQSMRFADRSFIGSFEGAESALAPARA